MIEVLTIHDILLYICCAGNLLLVGAELIVESEEQITRELLVTEAKLVRTTLKPTDCETITEKEDHYEVIVNKNGKQNRERIALGKNCFNLDYNDSIYISVSHLVNNSVLVVKTKTEADETTLFLRRYLNCLDQEDPKLSEALNEHYIRKQNDEKLN